MTFKELFESSKRGGVQEYSIEEIRDAMLDSGQFSKSQVMKISNYFKQTGKPVTPESRYSWEVINTVLDAAGIPAKKIARLLAKLSQ